MALRTYTQKFFLKKRRPSKTEIFFLFKPFCDCHRRRLGIFRSGLISCACTLVTTMSLEYNVCHLPIKTVQKVKHYRQHEADWSRNEVKSITAVRLSNKRKSSTLTSSETSNASQSKQDLQGSGTESSSNVVDAYDAYNTCDTYNGFDPINSLDRETIILSLQDPEDVKVLLYLNPTPTINLLIVKMKTFIRYSKGLMLIKQQ